ncbi:hypothetical protein E6D57_23765 [Escherichia coli]|nr:hypothetical protein [Escherichia coli]
MKLTDADNAADGIFFPALEQNMMGAVLINENDEVMFFNPAAEAAHEKRESVSNKIRKLKLSRFN